MYSSTQLTLNLLLYILIVVVLSCSFGPKRTKKPGTAKTVATAFCSCHHGEHSAGCCLLQTTFRSNIGDKRTRFPRDNSNANMHRSNRLLSCFRCLCRVGCDKASLSTTFACAGRFGSLDKILALVAKRLSKLSVSLV